MLIKVYYDMTVFLTLYIGYLIVYGFLDGINYILYNNGEKKSFKDSII